MIDESEFNPEEQNDEGGKEQQEDQDSKPPDLDDIEMEDNEENEGQEEDPKNPDPENEEDEAKKKVQKILTTDHVRQQYESWLNMMPNPQKIFRFMEELSRNCCKKEL